MKFRGKMTELMCMKQFAKRSKSAKAGHFPGSFLTWVIMCRNAGLSQYITNNFVAIEDIIAILAKLAKICVMRITHNLIYFIILEDNVASGKPMVWSVLEQAHFFNEYSMAGVSDAQNEIYLEFDPDVLAKALNMLRFSHVARSMKIKLTNKLTPCLTFEIELSSFSHSRMCVHDIPVSVIPRRQWSGLQEPEIPNFNISIELPGLKLLRSIVDRMKSLSSHLVISASRDGILIFKVETPEATVSTFFKELDVQNNTDDEAAGNANEEFFSARVDIKKFSQFLASDQVNPNKVVCNIVEDDMVGMFLVHEDVTLHYFLPSVSL